MNVEARDDFSELLEWLMVGTRDERFLDVIWADFCRKLRSVGLPISRASLHLLINHPQWLGARIVWSESAEKVEMSFVEHDVQDRPEYLGSPAKEIIEGAGIVREHLTMPSRDHMVYDDMRKNGLTDYVAWPLLHTVGKRHIVTYSTSEKQGFSDEHLALLSRLLPALALVSEIRVKSRLARTLLETYVGPHAGHLVLAGATRRGSGTSVDAAIMLCDMRDFTRISDSWPRDDVIESLNGYFDALAAPIERHGGEILKFMGDGILAIFPTDNPSACSNLLTAVLEAETEMASLNERRVAAGSEPLSYGVGLHVGNVMYGNIGSQKRLDFTVIGPAVNLAARLEALTKTLGRPVLMSETFAGMIGDSFPLEAVGSQTIKGFDKPVEVFSLKTASQGGKG